MEWELLGIILTGLAALYLLVFHIPYSIPHPLAARQGRETRFDVLRGFAMVGIVLIHIHSYFQFFHPADQTVTRTTLFLSNLSRFSVPVFILTSAIFLRKKEGYWISKLKNLVLPYSLASCLGYLVKYNNYNILEFIQFYLLGKVFAPFYFVPLLIQFYILFYLFDKLLTNNLYSKSLLFISLLLNLTSNLGFFDSILPKEYHSISILNYIFFFVLGIYIGLSYEEKENTKKKDELSILFLALTVLFLFFLILYSFGYVVDFKNHHIVYPIFFFFGIWQILPRFNRKVSDWISYIGNNSLFIFLLHPFIIHMMHSVDPYSFGGPILGYIVTLVLNVGIPIIIAFTIQKGKFLYRLLHSDER
ncbi:acyltransferase [Leptospira sp. 2 VSF19]|uniref:Acyltransferase n=1 Tax=Leptospira soteropolitanensis TaxID=2950025 RepID=A0AAW5VJS0_9LEPT|nr:acyltransferase [Leptospira soteropolitanensis]MCW7492732.1 acyltransferase [Leptospira soteropolitanensis]MCW7500415.1 acyltransferase [Leptospira soteropolitanensis]MCW7522550.1 acyltransferase [Leptospira soteropolitanensis]MCW7526406.1 acyltransferase [Leptospira soteropolitanensis]MCW7530385.1 acyltransferase [Leptospira soteropolitanensis]